MRIRALTEPISPALGVVPPSLRFAQSSTRPAPARSAIIADSRVSTATSIRVRPPFSYFPSVSGRNPRASMTVQASGPGNLTVRTSAGKCQRGSNAT